MTLGNGAIGGLPKMEDDEKTSVHCLQDDHEVLIEEVAQKLNHRGLIHAIAVVDFFISAADLIIYLVSVTVALIGRYNSASGVYIFGVFFIGCLVTAILLVPLLAALRLLESIQLTRSVTNAIKDATIWRFFSLLFLFLSTLTIAMSFLGIGNGDPTWTIRISIVIRVIFILCVSKYIKELIEIRDRDIKSRPDIPDEVTTVLPSAPGADASDESKDTIALNIDEVDDTK